VTKDLAGLLLVLPAQLLLTHRQRTPFAAAILMMIWIAGLLK
jgi:hypothetical protein